MNLLTILNVIYVLLAVAMVGFILVQRGAGAAAGSGFGAGASATVFGARGSANFLTKSTAILATAFFLLSIATGMYVMRLNAAQGGADLGIMGADTAQPATASPATEVPAAPVPAAPMAPAPAANDIPAAPAAATPASGEVPTAPPAEGTKDAPKQ